MIRKYGTINEEVNRIKSLFGESRLYGNLITEGDIEVDIEKELTDMENSQAVITARNNEYNKKIHLLITKNGERDKWGGVRQEPETAKEILKILNEWLVELEKDDIEFESRKKRLSSHESYDLYVWDLKGFDSPHIKITGGISSDVEGVIRNWGKVLKELGGDHNDEIIKDKEGGNPKNSDELIKIIMDPDSSDDDKKGAIDTLKSTFDIDLSDGKPLTIDSDTGVKFHEFNLEKPKEGPFGTYLSSDGVLIYKKEVLFSDLNITTTDPNAAEKLAAEDDKPKMKEGYNTEEDIIHKSSKMNKKYNIGKFVYDKKNDEFKIKSKYPFYGKRTGNLVKQTEDSFWETLSKWYNETLDSSNTSLEFINGKKFKVKIK